MSRVLILSPDHMGENMAGPAIRYLEMSRALMDDHEVTLGVIDRDLEPSFGVKTEYYDERNIEELLSKHDAVLISGFHASRFPVLREIDKAIIVDIYDPFVLENLELDSRRADYEFDTTVQNDILRLGDYFICASERQRDFWLGMFAALHRLNPEVYLADKTLRNLVDLVPFGISEEPPRHNKQVLKGVYPGIGEDDKVVIWGGGLYDWLDPITLIKAMAGIGQKRKDVKLFFMGTKHPNPGAPEMKIVEQSITLSKELGLFSETVFFNDWVPYSERENYLLEADVGLSLHLEHVETRLSFRTRVLDYIWAGLPVVATEGDAMADIIDRSGIGRTVAYGSDAEVAAAILELLDNQEGMQACRDSFAKVQEQFKWKNVIRPLARYLDNPRHEASAPFAKTDIEDLRLTLDHMSAQIRDKERHIVNLEGNVQILEGNIRDKDVLLSELNEVITTFPGSWLHQITRGYRFITRRNPARGEK